MNKIDARLDQLNWRLRDLAEASGYSVSYICNIKNGKRDPLKSTMDKIASALKSTVPDLFYPKG